MTTDSAKPKNLEIEYLRGIAVTFAALTHIAIVIPYHSEWLLWFVNVVAAPATGVDLFFCISGFVVSRAFVDYFDEFARNGRFALAYQGFWIRRAFRLLPTAWLWVLVGIACSFLFNRTGAFASPWDNIRSATVVLTACGNLAVHYGDLLRPNDVYWSLALEEQFYLLFPLYLLLVPVAWRWRGLMILIALQFFVDRSFNVHSTPAAMFAAGFRIDAMLWGILIQQFTRTSQYRQLEPTFLRPSRVALLVLNGLLLYLLVAMPAQFPLLPTTTGMVAVVAAALVFLASFESGYTTPLPLLKRFFVWLGARSYGVYIIHMAAYRMTFEAWSRYAEMRGAPLGVQDTVPSLLTAFALILLLAECNYRFVEVPMREKGLRLARQRLQEYAG